MRLGADPEVFLLNPAGKHMSAIGLVNADKWNPLQIPGMPKGFTLQEDNVSLEYGIPPAASADEFVAYIQQVMEASKGWIGNLSFSKLSCTIFEADQMKHPMAHVFGCEPDFNAWTGEINAKPAPPHQYMRSAGGHIHVETKRNPAEVARYMDLYHAVPSVMMDNGIERKQMYGKKGAFRPKPYGMEYRVLSNFWIAPGGSAADRERYCKWVWRATEAALNSKVDVDELEDYIDIAVNGNDKEMAQMLISEYNLEVV
jgi:hypothetical protein